MCLKLECGESGPYVGKQFHIIEPSVRTIKRSEVVFAYIHVTETDSHILFIFLFFSWGETESTWYCGDCLACCTSPR
jgi:hypothetical protein